MVLILSYIKSAVIDQTDQASRGYSVISPRLYLHLYLFGAVVLILKQIFLSEGFFNFI